MTPVEEIESKRSTKSEKGSTKKKSSSQKSKTGTDKKKQRTSTKPKKNDNEMEIDIKPKKQRKANNIRKKGNEKQNKTVNNKKKNIDHILGLKKPQLKRIYRKAGALRISEGVYEKMRSIAKSKLQKIVDPAIIFMINAGRTTLMPEDVSAAISNKTGSSLGYSRHDLESIPRDLKKAPASAPTSSSVVVDKKPSSKEPRRPHKSRPGMAALREARRLQKNPEALIFAHEPFTRLVRDIADKAFERQSVNNQAKIRLSEMTSTVLQLYIESYLMKLARAQVTTATLAKRQTIMKVDVAASRMIQHMFCA